MAGDDEKRGGVARILGKNLAGGDAASGNSAAMAFWQSARQDAIDDLQNVIEAVRDTGDLDADFVGLCWPPSLAWLPYRRPRIGEQLVSDTPRKF